MSKDIFIDGETADRITGLTLKQHRDWMQQDLDAERLHDSDYARYAKMVKYIDYLLENYFTDVPELEN